MGGGCEGLGKEGHPGRMGGCGAGSFGGVFAEFRDGDRDREAMREVEVVVRVREGRRGGRRRTPKDLFEPLPSRFYEHVISAYNIQRFSSFSRQSKTVYSHFPPQGRGIETWI